MMASLYHCCGVRHDGSYRSAAMNARPPIPPLYAAVSPAHGRVMLQSIPEELLKKIVSFGDVRSNVLLAACSSSFRRVVYRDCPSAWVDIDFGKVSQVARLSDADLHALLTNVNALTGTTSLSLMGCASIRGRGLEPLRENWRLLS